MRSPKGRGQAKYQDYMLVLEMLRWILANQLQIIRVVEPDPPDHAGPGSISTPAAVKFQILNLPIGHSNYAQFPVRTTALKRFLESAEFQKQFVRWYGKQIADSISAKGGPAKLVRRFSHLTAGRHGKLPPRTILRFEYDRLVAEMKALRLEPELPLDRKKRESLLDFWRRAGAQWVQFVDAVTLDLEQLIPGSPQGAAKLILSMKYSCSEEAVHSRLFHQGR